MKEMVAYAISTCLTAAVLLYIASQSLTGYIPLSEMGDCIYLPVPCIIIILTPRFDAWYRTWHVVGAEVALEMKL